MNQPSPRGLHLLERGGQIVRRQTFSAMRIRIRFGPFLPPKRPNLTYTRAFGCPSVSLGNTKDARGAQALSGVGAIYDHQLI